MLVVTIRSLPLIKAGSVKNLRSFPEGGSQEILFEFTDDFSVFDWGKMPDTIPGKGAALLHLATFFFREISQPTAWKDFFREKIDLPASDVLTALKTELETQGMRSCFRGLYPATGKPEGMRVEKLRMIPLEVVFRNGLTSSSSFFERNPGTRLKPGHRFDVPLIERFTKLEPTDRYIESTSEAVQIGKITREQLFELELRTVLLALFLRRESDRRELDLVDGKFEWGFDSKNRMCLADAIGPDELRLEEKRTVAPGMPTRLSKEFLREYYRGSPWFNEISERKKQLLTTGWQSEISLPAPSLPAEGLRLATSLYQNLARRFSAESILLFGGGAREHAIARKLLESPNLRALHWAPGQDAAVAQLEAGLKRGVFPGSYQKKIVRWESGYSEEKASTLIKRATTAEISLVVFSTDADLASGAADRFREAGLAVFGPSQAAAKIEWSKTFSKEVCLAAGVITPKAFSVEGTAAAREKLLALPWDLKTRWVVKADGLALGKGVVVAETREEALASLDRLAQYGDTFLIEEKITGEECSWFAFSDGESFSLLDPAKDYKRLGDRDQGPNTGGMGAVSPAPRMTPELRERIRTEVFAPIFRELAKRGIAYRGLLYAGLMIETTGSEGTPSGSIIRVLEFNARFGDPETQAVLPRMRGDLWEWMSASAKGHLSELPRDVPFTDATTVYVVAAAEGYPDSPKKGTATKISTKQIEGDAYRFAGLTRTGENWTVTGGRVLGALGLGKDVQAARNSAYAELEEILFPGAQIRKDIGV